MARVISPKEVVSITVAYSGPRVTKEKTFKTAGGFERWCLDNKAHIISIETVRKPGCAKTHWVRNIMSGKLFEELADTPFTCSPRSESYWSN